MKYPTDQHRTCAPNEKQDIQRGKPDRNLKNSRQQQHPTKEEGEKRSTDKQISVMHLERSKMVFSSIMREVIFL